MKGVIMKILMSNFIWCLGCTFVSLYFWHPFPEFGELIEESVFDIKGFFIEALVIFCMFYTTFNFIDWIKEIIQKYLFRRKE